MTRRALFNDSGVFDDGNGTVSAFPVAYGTPAPTWSTVDAIGSSGKAMQSDATLALFNVAVPATQAFGDSASAGTSAFAPRLDHKHAMPATPVTTIRKTGDTLLTGAVTLTGGTNVTLTQSGQDISIAAASGGTATAYFGTPTPTWGTANAYGASGLAIQTDATLAVFNTAVPVTQAFGDAAAAGTANFASRIDHKHAMPATSSLSGYEFDYVERTTDLAISATTDATATAFITGNAVSYDGSTRVKIEIWIVAGDIAPAQAAVLNLYDGSTDLGRMALANNPLASGSQSNPPPLYGVRFLTPSNASHTYTIKAWKTGGTCSLIARAGGTATYMPAWYRITKA